MKDAVTWLPWPSAISKRTPPLALILVSGSKHSWIQSSPIALQVQLFLLQDQLQSAVISDGIQEVWTLSPLKITNGLIIVPSTQMHSKTVTHSWRPGFFWYTFFSLAVQITYDFRPQTPILKPNINKSVSEWRLDLFHLDINILWLNVMLIYDAFKYVKPVLKLLLSDFFSCSFDIFLATFDWSNGLWAKKRDTQCTPRSFTT